MSHQLSDQRLAGRVALVTGAGRGIGRGIALALAADGATVAVAARTPAKAEPVVAEIGDRGQEAVTITCDVTDPDACHAAIDEVVAGQGRLDILVNNANVAPYGDLLEVSDKAFTLGFRVGPLATLRLMRAAHAYLRRGGVILNLTSGSALRADASGLGAYAAIKEATSSLTRTAAVEWGPDGIRVVALMPFAESEGMAWWRDHDADSFTQAIGEVPLGRIGDAEADVGRAAAWLCSDEAGYITGTTLVVDGGQSYLR